MNIYDISEKAGVSIATISRVINGNPKVNENTRRKVMQIIEESGYMPNAFARGLGLKTMKIVGILCADSSDPYLAQAISHIEKGLKKNNYASMLFCTGYVLDMKKKSMELLLSKSVDGIIMVGSNYIEPDDKQNDYIRQAAASVPLCIVNGILESEKIYCTVCDDLGAIYQMTQKFIENGKKKILYLYNSSSYSGIKKLEGFKKAFKTANFPLENDLIVKLNENAKSIEYIKSAIHKLWDKGIRFDGIIASDDIIGVSAVKFAREKGIKIPDELFVSGFNDFDIAECCDPELTSIDNSLKLLCNNSVETLMNLFGEKQMPKITVFSPKIIERQTTMFNINLL